MKLERLHEYILITVVILLGIAFALFAGSKVGAGQPKTVVMVLTALTLVLLAAKYNRKLWILIPLTTGFTGFVAGIPGGFLPFKDLVGVYVFGTFLALKALKIVRQKPIQDALDVLLILNLIYLASVLMRNPVGSLGIDSERIGGRPYFQIAAAYLAYLVLGWTTVSPHLAYKLPVWMVGGSLFEGFAGFIGDKVPWLGEKLTQFYTSFATLTMQGFVENSDNLTEGDRLTYLAPAGSTIAKTLVSYFTPSALINPLYFGRFLLLLLSVLFIFLSGYRSAFFDMLLVFAIASYFRSGMKQVAIGVFLTVPILAFLIIGQGVLFDLPLNTQRTLSFLPGHWSGEAKEAADGSLNWRVEMWKDVFFTDHYIHDKLLGDGFGINRREWEAVQLAKLSGFSLRLEAEEQAIMGTFHNGPLSTLRVVGYVGSVLYILLIFYTAYKAFLLTKRTKDTPFFPLTLLTTVPTIIVPFLFLIGGGFYDIDLERTIYAIGMIKLITRSFNEYEALELNKNRPGQADRASLQDLRPRLSFAG